MCKLVSGLVLGLAFAAPAAAKEFVYRCSGLEQTGIQSRTPGKSGGHSARKAFTLRIDITNNQIRSWTASGDRPSAIWVTQGMLATMPFGQSCRMNADGSLARNCNFSTNAASIVMMRMITANGETSWMIERIGGQPYTSRFRFLGHSSVTDAQGKTMQASSGTCVIQ